MVVKLKVESTFPALERELRTRYGTPAKANNAVDKAMVRGMNSGIRPAKTAAKKLVSAMRNLPAKRVDAGIRIQFATPENQVVALRARGGMIPLVQLKGGLKNPKQFARGVKVTTARGKRTLIPGAFLARGRRGIQVFKRGVVGGSERAPRLPILALKVPSIPHTLTLSEITEPAVVRFRGAYSNAYEKQLSAAIRRSNRRIAAR